MFSKIVPALALGAGLCLSFPAAARVHEVTASGFVLRQVADIPAAPEDAWRVLVTPSKWWSSQHSFSGDATNLSLDPRAGGCFCEVIPVKGAQGAPPRGSAEHMHVIYVERPRALRMTGALGPLQAWPVNATMTIQLQPSDKGTRLLMEYAVDGSLRGDPKTLATSVDLVLAEQILRLGQALGDGGKAAEAEEGEAEAKPDDDGAFEREMEAAIAEAGQTASQDETNEPQPSVPETPEPADEAPVFIGR